jgi:hypothetical protein
MSRLPVGARAHYAGRVRRLDKWQWNSIIEAIEEAGLDPRDFELDDDGDEARIRATCSRVWASQQDTGFTGRLSPRGFVPTASA